MSRVPENTESWFMKWFLTFQLGLLRLFGWLCWRNGIFGYKWLGGKICPNHRRIVTIFNFAWCILMGRRNGELTAWFLFPWHFFYIAFKAFSCCDMIIWSVAAIFLSQLSCSLHSICICGWPYPTQVISNFPHGIFFFSKRKFIYTNHGGE